MPWSYPDNVPAVAQNWTEAQQRRCVEAANAVLEETNGDEEQAIFACIAAAGKESNMERKVFKSKLELKADGEPGRFRAVFATLNVVDKDGDVTLPGAFTKDAPVRISAWSHRWDQLPVGRGTIREDGDAAIVDGAFFLNTQAGKEHYETVKALGDLQEWSYGFDIIEAEAGKFEGREVRFLKKLEVHEVSPVMLGAGIGTHTADIKAALTGLKFQGSPRNPYGTHSSRGYPGGRGGWRNAWRIYLSTIAQGPIQGTVRRIGMIAATMKCNLPEMSADDISPRSGACGELSGKIYENPGDYGMERWKDPSDDDLTSEDVQLTCQDLEDLKHACLAEIAKRHACENDKGADWQEMAERMHDMAVQLGAKCAGHSEHDAERDDKGQARDGALSNPSPSTVAARIATELIEMGFDPEGDSDA